MMPVRYRPRCLPPRIPRCPDPHASFGTAKQVEDNCPAQVLLWPVNDAFLRQAADAAVVNVSLAKFSSSSSSPKQHLFVCIFTQVQTSRQLLFVEGYFVITFPRRRPTGASSILSRPSKYVLIKPVQIDWREAKGNSPGWLLDIGLNVRLGAIQVSHQSLSRLSLSGLSFEGRRPFSYPRTLLTLDQAGPPDRGVGLLQQQQILDTMRYRLAPQTTDRMLMRRYLVLANWDVEAAINQWQADRNRILAGMAHTNGPGDRSPSPSPGLNEHEVVERGNRVTPDAVQDGNLISHHSTHSTMAYTRQRMSHLLRCALIPSRGDSAATWSKNVEMLHSPFALSSKRFRRGL